MSSTKLFLLYNDEDISAYIHPDIIPFKLNQTEYFESEAFRMLNESDLPNVENIGFITPSARFKIPNFSINKILQFQPNPITFLWPQQEKCEEQSVRYHGNDFLTLWKYLLDCHSIPYSIINTYNISYSNLWIAKKSFVIEYLKFAKKTIDYLDNSNAEIKNILFSNSRYSGKLLNTGLLEKKFNLSHYPFHPFIMERVVCLFTKTISNKNQTQKILVFMSDNRVLNNNFDNASYESLAACINKKYCDKNGYDFMYYRPYLKNSQSIELYNCLDPNTGEKRHASWSKLLSTKLALELKYDYVVYIDSDCIFKDFNMRLEKFIIGNHDKSIIFFNDKPWSKDNPCAGFYICKNCTETTKIIIEWFNNSSFTAKNIEHPWEQTALHSTYKVLNIAIVDEWMFEEVNGQFLRHIGSSEDKALNNRRTYFKEYITKNKLEYTINNINVIEFDTSSFTKTNTVVVNNQSSTNINRYVPKILRLKYNS